MEQITLEFRGQCFVLPYIHREGTGGPTVLFVHGLGGAKENFYAALQSKAMAPFTVIMFDEPGTGLSPYHPEVGLDVSGLADLTQRFAEEVVTGQYWLAGASMGGLISLLMIRRHGFDRLLGLINLEGNLCPEDCVFSRRVFPHTLQSFASLYEQMIHELKQSRFAGDQIVAHNMALNVDPRAYYAYSFETVRESDSGELFAEFVNLPLPKLFLYGEQNRTLSYLARLSASDVKVREISSSAHFLFYDNPVETFQAIAEFIDAN
jgi:pimeloyl-ACP methyl ester carboxylesterase